MEPRWKTPTLVPLATHLIQNKKDGLVFHNNFIFSFNVNFAGTLTTLYLQRNNLPCPLKEITIILDNYMLIKKQKEKEIHKLAVTVTRFAGTNF